MTLVELILVMTIISVVISVSAPSLSRFFRGRYVDNEAQRFLGLTRYAQSRAASEGTPMTLWIDTEKRTYGLHAEDGFVEEDPHEVTYTLADDIKLFVTMPDAADQPVASQWATVVAQRKKSETLLEFRFTPDGYITPDSPALVEFCERDERDAAIRVSQSRNRLTYEILPRTL